ncbi:hypothetical protein BD626DRAFT_414226, partial [Schizophyllum amplum]
AWNSDWKQYGPQGQDITDYAPHYPGSPTVIWPGGLRTVLPYLPDETSGRNKLEFDETIVINIARSFKDSRERPDLCTHVQYTNMRDAIRLIRECMCKGMPLVFDGFPDSLRWAQSCSNWEQDTIMQPEHWGDDPVDGVVGASLHVAREFHDAEVREVKPLEPYVHGTLLDFEKWLKSGRKVRCILDLVCGFPQNDMITERVTLPLADNIIESVRKAYVCMYKGNFAVPSDMLQTQDWFLLHTAGFFTRGHVDASGMATSAQIRGGGMKKWIFFSAPPLPSLPEAATLKERRAAHATLVQRMCDLILASKTDVLEIPERIQVGKGKTRARKQDEKWKPDGCIVDLRPGMKLYQPAGKVHAAYTPVPCAAAGKHWFGYGDLHCVELSRRVQRRSLDATNHNHNCAVQLMLISMAAALPARASAGQLFRKKPMIALSLMLMRPFDYIPAPDPSKADARAVAEHASRMRNAEAMAEYDMTTHLRDQDWALNGTEFERLAHTVAFRILHACSRQYGRSKEHSLPGPEYIVDGNNWEDPGPIMDVAGLTQDLLSEHVDDKRQAGPRHLGRSGKGGDLMNDLSRTARADEVNGSASPASSDLTDVDELDDDSYS